MDDLIWTDDPRLDELDGPAANPSSATPPPTAPVTPVKKVLGSSKTAIAGALLVGGVAGAAILGPLTANAASPAPSASSGTPSGESGTATGTPETPEDHDPGSPGDHGPGGPGGPFGGHVEAVTDTSVVATAIGISEADLKTALAGGQTVAAVAKAHNVSTQTVIDALVADGQSELAAAVKAGTITQAQADAEKAELTQRATDQVNGTLMGGQH